MLAEGYLLLRGLLSSDQVALVSASIPHPSPKAEPLSTFEGAMESYPVDLAKRLVSGLFGVTIDRVGPTLIPKLAGEAARGWHQDGRFWSAPGAYDEQPTQVGVMFYPDGGELMNGELRVIPGSHRRWTTAHARLAGLVDNENDGKHPGSVFSHAEQIGLFVRPNDVLLLDARTLHMATVNKSSRARRCLNVWCWFTPPDVYDPSPKRERML